MKKVFSLVVVFLFVISGILYAQSTAIYTPSSANSASSDRAGSTANPPLGPADAAWQALGAPAVTAMSTLDTNRYETKRTTARNQFDSQLFRFKVTQAIGDITKIDGTWQGYGEAQASYPSYLYIWNFNSSSWELLQSADIGAPDGTLTGNKTSNLSYYIDGSGYLYMTAQAKHYNYTPAVTLSSPGTGSTIWDTVNVTMAWTMSDLDGDSMQAYANVRRSDDGWAGNSGWLSAGTLSWNTNVSNFYYTYYWKVQVKDDLATSAFTSEWSFYTDVTPKSSCPFIFVWDGSKFAYKTDMAQGFAFGIVQKRNMEKDGLNREKPNSYYRPENNVIGENIPVKNNCYEIKVREMLDEVSYFDMAELCVIDHPAQYEIVSSTAEQASDYSNSSYAIPGNKYYAISKKTISPVSAFDENGNDILLQVLDADDDIAPIRGSEHKYVLDFGRIDAENPKLVLQGWRYINNKNMTVKERMSNYVEVVNNDGKWEKIREFGTFDGDFKTFAVHLGDIFKDRNDHRIRLTVYGLQATRKVAILDRISLDITPEILLEPRLVPMKSAVLSFAGRAEMKNFNAIDGRIAVSDESLPVNPRSMHYGNFTRYGEVRELLSRIDDHHVIMCSGDQVLLSFSALEDEVQDGYSRSFVLRDLLYYKGGKVEDEIRTVEPLPYVGMNTFPYIQEEGCYPMTPENTAYLNTYNTRKITKDDIRNYKKYYVINGREIAKNVKRIPHSLNTNYCEAKITYNTAPVAPSVPVLSTPADASTGVNPSITLTWQASSGTAPITYRVQVSTNSGFTAVVVDQSGISATSYAVSLSSNTQYWWHVMASNAAGDTAYSSGWTFTAGSAPSALVLSSPANAATNTVFSPTYSWNASTGTAPITYTLQVDDENTFADPKTVNISALAVTSFDPGAVLSANTVYYWRVQAANAIGTSSWSSTFSFTTGSIPSVPALSAPSDGATEQLPVSLEWGASTGSPSITYSVIVDNDSGFNSPEYNQGGIAATSAELASLSIGTYYWKVKATNGLGESNWSSVWDFAIVQNFLPSIPALTSPDDLSENVSTAPLILWEESSGTAPITYRAQIDVDSGFGTAVEYTTDSSWYQLSNLDNTTVYYWRVRGENIAGNSDWSAAYSFTTTIPGGGVPEAPNMPVLNMPSDGASDLAVDVVFGWTPSTTGTPTIKYTLQICMDSGMTDILYQQANITASYMEVNGFVNGMTLYWRIKAVNDYGESAWTAPWSFTTVAAPTAPSVPMLSKPDDGATYQPLDIFLIWDPSTGSGAITYTINADTDSGFPAPVQYTTTNTWYQMGGLQYDTTYYWRVKASNSVGETAWSATENFKTTPNDTAPAMPLITGPESASTDITLTPTLYWQPSTGTEPITYTVQLDADSVMSAPTSYTTTNTWYQLDTLQYSTTYYWRLKASNYVGQSGWTSTYSFTTIVHKTAPSTPALISPADAETLLPSDPALFWGASTGTTPIAYKIQVDVSGEFASPVEYSVSSTWQQLENLSYGMTYYWRVRAENSVGASSWSAPFSFTTLPSANQSLTPAMPTPPELVNPYNNEANVKTNVVFGWKSSVGTNPITYSLELYEDSNMTTLAYSAENMESTYLEVNGLGATKTYYWRLKAVNGFGESDWTDLFLFTTLVVTEVVSTPTLPVLSLPADDSSIAVSPVVFSWEPSTGGTGITYQLQVSTSSSFTAVISNLQNISDEQIAVAVNLVAGVKYYWKLRSHNEYGYSSWSETWSFAKSVSSSSSVTAVADTGTATNSTSAPEAKPGTCFIKMLKRK
ncbi:MAG: hypothetical protein HZA48_10550 [Planctomycetes bacterium]|nr:hypothetical protein [Planctomycetota bacterium]